MADQFLATEDHSSEQHKGVAISKIELFLFDEDVRGVAFDVHSGGIDKPEAESQRRRFGIVVTTKDGRSGEYIGGRPHIWMQARFLAEQVLGMNALGREHIYEVSRRHLRKEDRIGACALDNALWDLAGKTAGVPVARLLGGNVESRLPAYASTWFGGDEGGLSSPEQFGDFAEECLELGYLGFKMHGWTDGQTARDIAAIQELGQRLGGRMSLMYDSACHLKTFGDALLVGKACDRAEFFWCEDPYSDGGLSAHAHRRLRQMIKTPILLGEHVRGVEAMANLVAADGTDFIRADPDLDIGITGTMKIAALAEAFGLDVELHGCGPAHRHCMSAIRNTNFYELGLVGPSRGGPVTSIYACDYSDALDSVGDDGCFAVPKGPGLGVVYDWEQVRANLVKHVVIQ
ncbi:enolase C-terminal domain-like protein [Hoeflea prorocentri]|uniref:glucarate dehydratase n=1 Tax=Hoeflea prorocentri TaxID=1922333 RepID=A0A9X3UJP9_9HYPH|nr:enolase C-terminal domain-like protein [Hoeflea prorocentri]MCY6381909.1 mandelate racemase [Hoeflea prorocentri]MDA5399709.1 mandelate racemase [Hoeflea prorocentri]